jgi:hypothetical protein
MKNNKKTADNKTSAVKANDAKLTDSSFCRSEIEKPLLCKNCIKKYKGTTAPQRAKAKKKCFIQK